MDYDMNMRLRELMALRLDDAVGEMQIRVTTDPMVQLVRSLCESCMWIIRDWPGQNIDNAESVRSSRLDVMGRLRQLLRTRPPKNSEMDGLILLLADALLTISEQWPGGDSDGLIIPDSSPTKIAQQLRIQHVTPSTPPSNSSVHIPPLYGTPGSACKPPAPKLQRIIAKPWTVDGHQQPSLSTSHSNSFPPPNQRSPWKRDIPQANNAGTPSRLWSFFTKATVENQALFAKCSVCGCMIPRYNHGTSGMKNHLKVHHPVEFASLAMESRESSKASTPVGPSPNITPNKSHKKDLESTNSAIIAMLQSGSVRNEKGKALFTKDVVKEEELDHNEDDPLEKSFDNDANDPDDEESNDGPALETSPQQWRNHHKSSDIWSYFTKADVEGEKHGCCNLCQWSRKIYNHGTNTMWCHLKRSHPMEYSVLKPYEFHPVLHGQSRERVGVTHALPEGVPVPSHLTLPRPPENN